MPANQLCRPRGLGKMQSPLAGEGGDVIFEPVKPGKATSAAEVSAVLGAVALAGGALAAPGAGAGVSVRAGAVAASANTVSVMVNTHEGLGTIPPTAYPPRPRSP